MKWKFWESKNTGSNNGTSLPKPKELPDTIGMHLVVGKKMDPDFVWALKCVMKPTAGSSSRHEIRLYSPEAARDARVPVTNYSSLDAHPELILFHGHYDKRAKTFDLQAGHSLPEIPLTPQAPTQQPRA